MEKTNSPETFFLNFLNGNYSQHIKDDELSNNDSKSAISESLVSDNIRTESTINDYQDCEIGICPFTWD